MRGHHLIWIQPNWLSWLQIVLFAKPSYKLKWWLFFLPMGFQELVVKPGIFDGYRIYLFKPQIDDASPVCEADF